MKKLRTLIGYPEHLPISYGAPYCSYWGAL